MCGKYYVYELAEPDGHVFYVGKGTGSRMEQHEKEAMGNSPVVHNSRKVETIRQVMAKGGKVLKNKVADCISSEALAYAIEYERLLIYGYKNLTNRSGVDSRGKFLFQQVTGKTRQDYD